MTISLTTAIFCNARSIDSGNTLAFPDAPPIQRWSTAELPKAHRIDYFAAALSEAIVPLGLDRVDPASFEASMSFARLDSIGISKASASAHRSFRGPQEIARTGAHSFCLLMAFNCALTADHRGKCT